MPLRIYSLAEKLVCVMTEVHIVSSGGVGRNDNTIRGQVWKVFREKIPELGPKRGKGACHLGRMENGIPD